MSPNQEYLELNFVAETATGRGTNEKVIMERISGDCFNLTIGRVGIRVGRHKPRTYLKNMAEWEPTYARFTEKGYLVTKKKKMEKKKFTKGGMVVNGTSFATIENASVRNVVEELLDTANQAVESNYTVTVDDISDEMFQYGKSVLDDIADNYKNMSVAQFNNKLKILYAAIPRRMDRINDMLAKRKQEFVNIIHENQELFDIIHGQLRNSDFGNINKDILQSFNLEWRPVTDSEKEWVIKKMGPEGRRYIEAWRIINHKTENPFNGFCEKENLSEENGISHLFHGSRSENFWSIITNGLTVNPHGVIINGKMFGQGTYFAPLSTKSMGYTSMYGSRWSNGDNNHGFMGIYKVATGKCYDLISSDSSLNWRKLQEKCPGAHCTWAHGRTSSGKYASSPLYNDEVIVYQDNQSTIEYFVKFSA